MTHWNAFVANLEVHEKGTFYDPRLNDPVPFPIAAANGFGNVRSDPDLGTSKLAALHLYQLAIPAPKAPEGSFDRTAAARGKALFESRAQCAVCHVPPLFTEPDWNMHRGEDIGIDSLQADRSPDALSDGSFRGPLESSEGAAFTTMGDSLPCGTSWTTKNSVKALGLTGEEVADVVEYLKSL